MTVTLPTAALIDKALPGGRLPIPPNYFKMLSVPGFKVTGGSLDFDENKAPKGASIEVAVDIKPLDGTGSLTVDKNGDASGTAHINFHSQKIPGIKETTVDAAVNKDDFNLDANLEFDLPHVTGTLSYKYENKQHSGKGTAKYEGSKLKGDIEIVLSEAGKISGSGKLEMELFKGLRGEVAVAVDEKRDIKVEGEISLPGQVELFPEKKIEKSFFSFEKKFPLWGITIPVIDVNVGLFAEVHAGAGFRAKFGPGVLRDLALTGKFGTDPEAATEFGLGGEFFVPAGAEIVVNAGGGIGLGLAIADITGGVEAVGVAGIYTALSVRPQFKYAGGKYSVGGVAELAGVAQAKLSINAFAKIDVGVWMFKGTVWRKDWNLAEWVWNAPLPISLRATINYTLGADFAPEINFETPDIDPEKLVKDVMPESGSPVPAPPKPAVPEKGGFNANDAQGKQAEGAPKEGAPTPTAGSPSATTQAGTAGQQKGDTAHDGPPSKVKPEAAFEAAGESHRLFVKLEGNKPQLMIASGEQDFSSFIAEINRRINDLRGASDDDKAALRKKVAALTGLESQVESTASVEYDEAKVQAANAKLATMIAQLRELLPSLKPNMGGIGTSRNIAIARIDMVDNVTGVRASGTFVGTSRQGSPTGTVPTPAAGTENRAFDTKEVGGFVRDFDGETKLYEFVAKKFNTRRGQVNENVTGVFNLNSEYIICASCQDIKPQFQAMFPKVNVLALPLP